MNDLEKIKVYVYCDPRFNNKRKGYKYEGSTWKLKLKNKPFYIGCASGKRHLRHIACGVYTSESMNNRIKKIRTRNLEPIIIILKIFENNKYKKALFLEKELISVIGKSFLNKGPLLNVKDGGEYHPFKNKHHSPESLKKISKNHADVSGKNHPMYGRLHTEETLEKISKNHANMSGKNNPMYGMTREKCPMWGKWGEEAPASKLKEKQVHRIRNLSYKKGWSQNQIAKKFKVSRGCIQKIVLGYHWNPDHLTKEELKRQFVNIV